MTQVLVLSLSTMAYPYSHDGLGYMWTAHGAYVAGVLDIGDIVEGDAFETDQACTLGDMNMLFEDAVNDGLIRLSLYIWTACGAGISPALLGGDSVAVAPGDEVTDRHFALLKGVDISKECALEHDIIIALVDVHPPEKKKSRHSDKLPVAVADDVCSVEE